MNKVNILAIVNEQIESFEEAKLISPPSTRYEGFDLDHAYTVAGELFKWRCRNGQKSIGRKIGFTNQAIWEDHGLNTPIWAHMYEDTVQFANDNMACLSLNGMVLPRIEPEIVFKLKSTPIPTDTKPADILKHIEWVAPGIEIVGSHFPDWKFSPADAVADFGVHAALIIGTPMQINEQDIFNLSNQLETFHVVLRKNNHVLAEGVGKNVLGNPASALGFLQNVLNNQPEAAPLMAGEIITTGTVTSALPVAADEHWFVDIDGIELPSLEIKFAK